MNKPRPILTAACFLLFVLVLVSSNVMPQALHCGGVMVQVKSVQRMVGDVSRAVIGGRR